MDGSDKLILVGNSPETPSKKRRVTIDPCKEECDVTPQKHCNKTEEQLKDIGYAEINQVLCNPIDARSENRDAISTACSGQHSPKVIHPGRSSPGASSTASESDWQPPSNGAIDWIHSQMLNDKDPREILHKLIPSIGSIPSHVGDWDIWRILVRILSEPPRRTKLSNFNTFDDVIRLLRSSSKIIVLTGAGVSVSCGIPDFRSRDGVYARLAVDFPDLPNPEAMFDISYFRHDPRPFFKFAKEIYPGQYKPSLIHRFIYSLEQSDRLLRNYTQNIDTLEQVAGIKRVVQCHGSFATATCQVCKYVVDCDAIREDIFNQVVPHCPRCPSEEAGILKPDIVFFGENLPEHFHRQMKEDKEEVDLLIVIGSALKVRPVALIPSSIPKEIPQILINREPLSHMSFDVELLGDGDVIVAEICRRLGDEFKEIYEGKDSLIEISSLPDEEDGEKDETTNSPQAGICEKSHDACSFTMKPSDDHVDGDVMDVGTQSSSTIAEGSEDSVKDAEVQRCGGDLTASNDSDDGLVEASGSNRIHGEEEMRSMWRSRWKQSISKRLPAGTYYYDGKHRYIFSGAEVSPEERSDSEDEESSDSSSDGEEVYEGLSPLKRPPLPCLPRKPISSRHLPVEDHASSSSCIHDATPPCAGDDDSVNTSRTTDVCLNGNADD